MIKSIFDLEDDDKKVEKPNKSNSDLVSISTEETPVDEPSAEDIAAVKDSTAKSLADPNPPMPFETDLPVALPESSAEVQNAGVEKAARKTELEKQIAELEKELAEAQIEPANPETTEPKSSNPDAERPEIADLEPLLELPGDVPIAASEIVVSHENQPKTEQEDFKPVSKAEAIRNSGLAYSAAIALFGSVAFMLIMGWFADLLLGTQPWGIVVGITLGAIIGFLQFFRLTSRIINPKPNDFERVSLLNKEAEFENPQISDTKEVTESETGQSAGRASSETESENADDSGFLDSNEPNKTPDS